MVNNQNKNSTYYTHGFHPYPAKYTPQLVNKFFNLYCKYSYTILDPFCGSGTTLVEGVLNGMNSVGIDLNPIACIISRAKTNHYSKYELNLINKLIAEIPTEPIDGLFYGLSEQFIGITPVPDFPNRSHWFQENVSQELTALKSLIDTIDVSNVKDLFLCAFSKIIVKVSNQDSEVRYTAKPKNHPNGVVFSMFKNTLKNYLNALEVIDYQVNANAEIYNGDSFEILSKLPDDRFDFIITSPPYINTFDYYLYHKQRMFWLGYDHRPIREKEIGNHHKIDTKKFDVAKKE